MKTYPDHIPAWFSDRFTSFLWHKDREQPTIYLTFDDGPTPDVTTFVMDLLDSYNFKATFFCIGKCVRNNPDIYNTILAKGHAVGNHTNNHLNSWRVTRRHYLKNVDKAARVITSKLFRPPYGKISPGKYKQLLQKDYTIVLWDVLSGDFDNNRNAQSILENVCQNTQPGSIIVFHDSVKCFSKLKEVLPKYFEFLKSKGLCSKALH